MSAFKKKWYTTKSLNKQGIEMMIQCVEKYWNHEWIVEWMKGWMVEWTILCGFTHTLIHSTFHLGVPLGWVRGDAFGRCGILWPQRRQILRQKQCFRHGYFWPQILGHRLPQIITGWLVVDVVVVAVVVGCGVKGKRLERRVRGVYGNMWWRPSATVACIHRRVGGDTRIDTNTIQWWGKSCCVGIAMFMLS